MVYEYIIKKYHIVYPQNNKRGSPSESTLMLALFSIA